MSSISHFDLRVSRTFLRGNFLWRRGYRRINSVCPEGMLIRTNDFTKEMEQRTSNKRATLFSSAPASRHLPETKLDEDHSCSHCT